jgi:hypothetical protein
MKIFYLYGGTNPDRQWNWDTFTGSDVSGAFRTVGDFHTNELGRGDYSIAAVEIAKGCFSTVCTYDTPGPNPYLTPPTIDKTTTFWWHTNKIFECIRDVLILHCFWHSLPRTSTILYWVFQKERHGWIDKKPRYCSETHNYRFRSLIPSLGAKRKVYSAFGIRVVGWNVTWLV